MAFEQKPGFGSLFVNDKKGNDARPDRAGTINFEGIMLDVAGWVKDGKKGQWLSLKVKRMDSNPVPVHMNKPTEYKGPKLQQDLTEPVDDYDQDQIIPF